MLTLKSMHWDNCFSYGDNNIIDFNKNPLTQLIGINGAGKTAISLMLQEVLYGKNNKNIKKQDIANNKSGKKGYRIELFFEKDGDEYAVKLNRLSNLKFKLFKNSKDISSHTSLNTYKTLNDIIGVADFKVFCQLIYQHSTDSLEFLTATDTNRKKFLISLLQLDRYLELHELFKDKGRTISSDILVLNGKVSTIESWISKHKDMDFVKRKLYPVKTIPSNWIEERADLEQKITNINQINRKIATNNEYIEQLNKLNAKYYLGSPPSLPNPSSTELNAQLRVLEHQYNIHQEKIKKISDQEGECPTCFQEIDPGEQEKLIDIEVAFRNMVKVDKGKIWDIIPETLRIEVEIKNYHDEKIEFERLSQLIDRTLSAKTLDLQELKIQLEDLDIRITSVENKIQKITAENIRISAHNSKVDVIKNQLKEMKKDLQDKNIELTDKEILNDIIELLKKTFGTNGLVSYKIESSVKELEKKINQYLTEITDFQMYFKLAGEKLNLEIFDGKNNQTAIQNLSSGERARLNLASVLAIRNILSTLTNTKINLLFLDEITGSLDAEGKEKFTEILLRENLNTFFVSHEWSHPLVPQINIIKENDISRIEND